MEKKMKLKPVNRWILIEPPRAKEEEASAVLLPDDFKSAKERYGEFQVVSISDQCSRSIRQGHKIIADNTIKINIILYIMRIEIKHIRQKD